MRDDEGNLRFRTGPHSSLRLGGYVEAFYSYNLNRPSNNITNYRAFDNRHNQITLQALALDVGWDSRWVSARLAMQAGHAATAIYEASEPFQPGTGSGAGTSDASMWRFVQQAYLGGHLPTKVPVTIEAGLFLSPLGSEALATNQNWTWSHTPLFFALPFYHAGLRANVQLNDRHSVRLGVYNGWNNVVDNNREKSFALEYNYALPDRVKFSTVYFSGVERPDDAPEGRAWRHTLDSYVIVQAGERVSLLLRPVVGIEPNAFGISWYVLGNVGLRVMARPWLYFAARGSLLRESRATSVDGEASPITIPSEWMAAGIFTIDFRVINHLSIKLEYRHDHASEDIFFAGQVDGDGSDAAPFVANARLQNTVTLGATAYF
ncbi:MAG: outer membrane beta-barrel protein [Nannocystaceae bacterium]